MDVARYQAVEPVMNKELLDSGCRILFRRALGERFLISKPLVLGHRVVPVGGGVGGRWIELDAQLIRIGQIAVMYDSQVDRKTQSLAVAWLVRLWRKSNGSPSKMGKIEIFC